MNKETGGPAFPFIDSASPLEHPGMTLRDYFAAKALQGFCASMHPARYEDILRGYTGGDNECKVALTLADAMISEREK